MIPDFEPERLRGRKLFVGTPMHDGKCCSEYAFAIAQLAALCTGLGIDLRFWFACHEALITKARNATVDQFLRSGDDHLLFIDADIGFDPRDILHMLALQSDDGPGRSFDIVAAPYPLKRLSWDRVLRAAQAGLADADPDLLARYSSAVSISPVRDGPFPVGEPVEVTQAGTGCMMIRRDTFARLRDHRPGRTYRAARRGLEANASPEIYAYFETEVDGRHANIEQEVRAFLALHPDAAASDILAFLDGDQTIGTYSGQHVSEDYAFCRRAREAGMQVWLCPWMELTHSGNHQFTARLADLGAIGAL